MKKTRYLLITTILGAVSTLMMAGCTGPVKNEQQLRSVTEDMQKAIQARLLDLDSGISAAADKIAVSGLQGEETRAILNGLCGKYPFLMECASADTTGKLITVAPEEYRRYEGTDTATTDASKKYFADFVAKRKPMLSNIFKTVEGPDAVVLVRPVVTGEGEMLGVVSVLIKPEKLVGDIIGPIAERSAIKVNVAQTDALVIYCSNGAETGKNLLTDPRYKAYPELIAMGEKLVVQKTGTAEYTYISDATRKPVTKTVYWVTVGLHGTEWRLASITELVE